MVGAVAVEFNIAFLLLFACAAALVLRLAGMRLGDSFLFAGIGFGAHIFGEGPFAKSDSPQRTPKTQRKR